MANTYIGQSDMVIDLYYYLLLLEKSDNPAYYHMLKTRFLANNPGVPEVLTHDLAATPENFIAKQIRAGHEQLVHDLWMVYRKMNEIANSKGVKEK